MKTTGTATGILPVACGAILTALISLALAALISLLVGHGAVPAGALPAAACGISGLSSMCGAWACGRRAERAKLPLCLVSAAVYLLVIFVLRGVCFRSVSARPWVILLAVVAGGVAGALLSLRQKKRRR